MCRTRNAAWPVVPAHLPCVVRSVHRAIVTSSISGVDAGNARGMQQRLMNARFLLMLAALLVCGPAASAQPTEPPAGQVSGQAPDRGRPTKHDDEQPLLDFDKYCLGAPWTFEWDVPEGPLGGAGRITGTTTYKALGGRFYEATTAAEGPDGTFTVVEVLGYHKESKVISRHVTDSRGFAFDEIANVGADLGRFYNILFESAPFTAGGHTLRIRHTMRLNAPLAYRVSTSVSVDDGTISDMSGLPSQHQARSQMRR